MIETRPPAGQGPTGTRPGLFEYSLGLIACVGFPALWTAIAPVSRISLSAHGDRVAVTATRNILLVVPAYRQTLDEVTSVGDRVRQGEITRSRGTHGRTTRDVRSEDEGFLQLGGPQGSISVPVSPVSLKSVRDRVEGFLEHPRPEGLALWVVANWKFSLLGGVPLTLLAGLYLVGVTLAIGKFLLGLGRAPREPH